MLASSYVVPGIVLGQSEGASPRSDSEKGETHVFEHLVIRGDELCWARDENGGYPFVDLAARAGATGLHIWGGAPEEEFIARCRERNLTVHKGMGVGSYGVCDGEDPREPAVLRKIKDHVARELESHDYDGIEFQTGEYDTAYSGAAAGDTSWARKLVDSLNPIIEYTSGLKDSLWIRTELLMSHFTDENVVVVSKGLDPRCTVEWSRFTGPFEGEDAFQKGRELLDVDKRFSWFLKTLFYLTNFWYQVIVGREEAGKFLPKERARLERMKEIPVPPMTLEGMRVWADCWREWVRMLHEKERKTLTICHVPVRMPMADSLSRVLLAAVALAREPDTSSDQVLSILGLQQQE